MSTQPITLICDGCGAVAWFPSARSAYIANWDCPPYFTLLISCPRCSSAEILLRKHPGDTGKAATLALEKILSLASRYDST